ncbi:DUF389 domain-containing protein [Inhella sp.]|uniref:DUF389 domain-containing protein n=1 Tax=Inhella sp. TaxID=1921806 RepID=UPI0035B36B87
MSKSTASGSTGTWFQTLSRALNLRRDLDRPEQIDADIRDGVAAVGTNLWVLMLAILIASIGLNVNSTAVIIGAMLISPLMGPIIGIGYALAIRDFELLRQAGRNLAVFTVISLATSTLYFTLSPLHLPGSELLARTTPTLWDVLIAFFGGCAGIIALTRHSFTNVLPGVAIATALMPPLCTAGFALSQGRWDWFFGAFYLFAINGVFIAYAALLFVKLMRLRRPMALEAATLRRARGLTALTLLVVVVPSIYLAWRLVVAQGYQQAIGGAIEALTRQSGAVVLSSQIDTERREVELVVDGAHKPSEVAEQLREILRRQGDASTQVAVRSAGGRAIDVGGLKRELELELLGRLGDQDQALQQQKAELAQLRDQLAARPLAQSEQRQQLQQEIAAQHPQLAHLQLVDPGAPQPLTVVADWRRIQAAEQQRLRAWLAVRLPGRDVLLAQVLSPR